MGFTKTYCPDLSGLNLIPPVLLYRLSQPRMARITVTPYKSVIRYKYSGEDWVEIEGDNYTFDNQNIGDTIEIPWYFIEGTATVSGRFPYSTSRPVIFDDGETIRIRSASSHPGVDINSISTGTRSNSYHIFYLTYIQNSSYQSIGKVQNTNCHYRNSTSNIRVNEPENNQLLSIRQSDNIRVGGINPTGFGLTEDTSKPPLICRSTINQCIFKVYKCGSLVYEETREDCPEVEIDNCILDYQNQEIIEIDISPFDSLFVGNGILDITDIFGVLNLINSTLNVIPFPNSFNDYLRNLLDGNSDECSIIFTFENFTTINILRQFCSTCDCPPPQIIVDCDPIEQCPYNTECEIDCGSYICCYDKEGKHLKTIIK